MKKSIDKPRSGTRSTRVGSRTAAAGPDTSSPTNRIYIKGEDGEFHHAQIRKVSKESKKQFRHNTFVYLYLRYRDGEKIKDLYLGKMDTSNG